MYFFFSLKDTDNYTIKWIGIDELISKYFLNETILEIRNFSSNDFRVYNCLIDSPSKFEQMEKSIDLSMFHLSLDEDYEFDLVEIIRNKSGISKRLIRKPKIDLRVSIGNDSFAIDCLNRNGK